MDNAIIIFIKNPVGGKVKTRLAATVGNTRALNIHLTLAAHTLKIAEQVAADKYIYFSDEIDPDIGPNTSPFKKRVQSGADLGEKMKNAFSEVLSALYKKVIIIGSDCPGINPEILQSAFHQLSDAEIVMGPAADGGYYLLGMKTMHPQLFDNIEWSSPSVLQTSINCCVHNNLRYKLLEELTDIDEEKDLPHFYRLVNQNGHD